MMDKKAESRFTDLNLKHDSLVSRIENLYHEDMQETESQTCPSNNLSYNIKPEFRLSTI